MVVEALLAGLAAAACEPTTATELDRELAAAEDAYVHLEITEFLIHSDRVRSLVPCLVNVPDVDTIARMNRIEGFRKFGERDGDAVRAFAAARALDPEYTLGPEVAPSGSPLVDDYVAMDLEAGRTRRLPEPSHGALWVDGRVSLDRSEVWPSLVQLVDERGVRWSVYGPDETPLPDYTPRGRRTRVALGALAAASAVGTGVAYGLGLQSRATWADASTPMEELAGLRSRTNVLGATSVAGVVMTAGLTTALVVRW